MAPSGQTVDAPARHRGSVRADISGEGSKQPSKASPSPPPRSTVGPRMWFWLGLWGIAVAGGLGYLASYSNKPGERTGMPKSWPENSRLVRNPDGPTLVMFIHPHCPCSRASLSELSRLLARSPERVEVLAVFIRPHGFEPGWERGGLWKKAVALPGVRTFVDPGGDEARRFDARTSGQVGVYDRDGRLRFEGGITAARAHEGDNVGSEAVRAWLNEGHCTVECTDVFGCPLFDDNDSRTSRGR